MRRLVSLLIFSPLSACLTPPAVLPALSPDMAVAAERLPSDARSIEVTRADGAVLKGVFVPSDEGAPVVLHLQEAAGSVAMSQFDAGPLFERLADLGFASLMVDYTGVGISEGKRSPKNLERDALAMWDAALERTGGDPGRIVVRGVSLGTLAAMHLHRNGARPAGWDLVLPVRAETATVRYAKAFEGPFLAAVAGLIYGPITDVDIVEDVARIEEPVLVVSSEEDPFLDEEERRDLMGSVTRNGGEWRDRPGGHLIVGVEARHLLWEEVPFYRRLFPEIPDAAARAAALVRRLPEDLGRRLAERPEERTRLETSGRFLRSGDATSCLAAALGNADPLAAAWANWRFGARPEYDLPLDARIQALSLEGHPQPIPLSLLEQSTRLMELTRRTGSLKISPALAMESGAVSEEERNRFRLTVNMDPGPSVGFEFDARTFYHSLRRDGLSREDAGRQYARILVFASGYPHRVVERKGELELEWHQGTGWTELKWRATIPEDAPESAVPVSGAP